MSQLFQQSEGTAEQRRFLFACVDDTDGKTPEPGLTFSGSELQWVKVGAAGSPTFAALTNIASTIELTDGLYIGEATAAELNTVGIVGLKIEKTGVRLVLMQIGQVVPWDPYAVTNMGLTALPAVASGSAGAIPTTGTGANQIAVDGAGNASTDVKKWNALTTVALPLVPTTAGRTLDVSPGGEAGIDLANVGSPTTVLNLSGTTIKDVTDVNTDTDTLLVRLSAARAGYLDNLNVGGNVASSAEATAIQNNTRVVRVVPESIERPDAGSITYRIELLLYDTVGNMEAPDSAPTIALVNQSGTDRSGRLDSTTMAPISTGRYRAIYTADVADTLEQLVWAFSVVEGGATRIYGNTSLIVDTTAVDFTAADRTKLETLATDYTTARAAKIDNLDAAITTRATPAQVENAVWDADPADHDTASTFGAILQSISVSSIAAAAATAVWAKIGEGTDSYGDMMRGIISGVLYKVTDFTSGILQFKSSNGAKTRRTVHTDATGRIASIPGDYTP